MVIPRRGSGLHLASALVAATNGKSLPPPTRAAAQMALIAIALVGLLLIVMVLLGGHWVRRQGMPRRGPVVPPDREPLPRTKLSGGAGPSAKEGENGPDAD